VADFVFATCLAGMEPALKLDVARARPELRLAFSRPGLVTFKSLRPVTDDEAPGSVFARVWGRSIGAAGDPAAAAGQLATRPRRSPRPSSRRGRRSVPAARPRSVS
jgi:23S rRNA (cytidine2498-2'-O)-methyltransferase